MTKVSGGGLGARLCGSGVTALFLALLMGCSSTDNGLTKTDYRNLAERTPPGPPPGSQPGLEPPIPEMQPILAAPPPPALEQRLVTVNVPDPEVPLRDVLIELARKVGVDLDLDPKISGGIILYAKDRPFAEVIDRICEMANLRYQFKDNVLRIELDTMVNRDYRLEVLNSIRKAKTEVATSTDVFSSIAGGGGGGGSNNSTSDVSSESTIDSWKEISDNLTQILTNSNPASQPVQSNIVGKGNEQAAVVAAPVAKPATKPGAAAGAGAGGAPASAPAPASLPAPDAATAQPAPAAAGLPAPAPGAVATPGGAAATGGGESTSNQAADTGDTGGLGGAGPGGASPPAATNATTPTTPAAPATAATPAANPLAQAQQNLINQATGTAAPAAGVAAATPAASTTKAPATEPKAYFTINKAVGIISVFGTSRQHKLVREYLDRVIAESTAQVLIEAKVVEVDLNDQFKAGIDWQRAQKVAGGAFSFGTVPGSGGLTGGNGFLSDQANFAKQALNAATQNPFSLAWTGTDFAALLEFVQGFGTTRTLSSPRITVLNNQTAVLKVAQNQVYFQLTASITPSTTVGVQPTSTFSSTLHTVPIGVVMTVQPVIDTEKGQVTMSLRPTVSVHSGDVADPAVALSLASACASSNGTGACSQANIATAVTNSNVPVVEVREMDSVVTVPSGEIVIMGGLMLTNNQKQETGLPGASDVPVVGNLFKVQSHENDVTELVIFLKASIVHGNDSVEWADRDLYKRYIQDPRPLAF